MHSAVQVWVQCDSLKGQGEGGGSMLSTAPGLWWTLSNRQQPWLLLPLLGNHRVWRKICLRPGSDSPQWLITACSSCRYKQMASDANETTRPGISLLGPCWLEANMWGDCECCWKDTELNHRGDRFFHTHTWPVLVKIPKVLAKSWEC